jgi:uncharacterized protein (UPF0248 family)
MLPINEKIKIDGIKYNVETVEHGYLITSPDAQFIIYQDGKHWRTADSVPLHLIIKLGKKIEELVWFRAMGM